MTADVAPRLAPIDLRDFLVPVGGVLFALAVTLAQTRMDEPWGSGVHLVIALLAAVVLLGAGLLGDRPDALRAPGATMLLLAGVAMVVAADVRLLEVLGADEPLEGRFSLVAFFLIIVLVAAAVTARTGSAACLLVTAIAAGGLLIAAVRWIFDTESEAVFRVVFTVLALVFAAAAARAAPGRYRDVLVDAAGVALLGLTVIGGGLLGVALSGNDVPWPWEAVALAGGLALAVYSAATRAPGPGVLAILVLASFVTTAFITEDTPGAFEQGRAPDATVAGWPVALLVLALLAVALGVTQMRGRR